MGDHPLWRIAPLPRFFTLPSHLRRHDVLPPPSPWRRDLPDTTSVHQHAFDISGAFTRRTPNGGHATRWLKGEGAAKLALPLRDACPCRTFAPTPGGRRSGPPSSPRRGPCKGPPSPPHGKAELLGETPARRGEEAWETLCFGAQTRSHASSPSFTTSRRDLPNADFIRVIRVCSGPKRAQQARPYWGARPYAPSRPFAVFPCSTAAATNAWPEATPVDEKRL